VLQGLAVIPFGRKFMSAQFEQSKSFLMMEDCLLAEQDAEIKHEYIDGELFAMAGASDNHNKISTNLLFVLMTYIRANQLPCFAYINDMKVKITHRKAFYPDVMVVCQKDNENAYYKTQPTLIIEVLSKSTRQRDKMLKRLSYQAIPTLEEYVLIEQDFCEIAVFRRKEGWQSSFYYQGENITFDSIGLTVAVADVYYQVNNEDMQQFLANPHVKIEQEK
jgi:Uma2 family endonuclease